MSDHHSIYSRKVRRVYCHVGIQVGAQVVTSVDADKDGATMYVTPVGVLVETTRKNPDRPIVISWSHIGSVELAPEPAPQPAKTTK